MEKKFSKLRADINNENWAVLTSRKEPLYGREDDIRSPFGRDYTRVLHCLAFRRLRHKNQVLFNAGDNDHICTRIEHVLHVESVSSTIADYLGLNAELTKAVSMAHDIGHAPFGHQGEKVLDEIAKEYLNESFWHEKNGLYFVDDIELLEDNKMNLQNLNLTYAVRDGIISHCGEVDQCAIRPREELFDLEKFESPGQYEAATWEGCVVKISDKIAYLGRDIEDARRVGILDEDKINLLREAVGIKDEAVNTTVIMHNAIIDLCKNSSPQAGLSFSDQVYEQISAIKKFNYEYIYRSKKLAEMNKSAQENLRVLFSGLKCLYDGENTLKILEKKSAFSEVAADFGDYLSKYCDIKISEGTMFDDGAVNCRNRKIYGMLEDERSYYRAVIDYIAGMTDIFAEKAYKEMDKLC